MCLDLDHDLDGLRAAVAAASDDWIELLSAGLGIADRRRARSFAGFVLTAIEGAYIRGRAERSGEPFLEAGRWLADAARRETARRVSAIPGRSQRVCQLLWRTNPHRRTTDARPDETE